MIIHNNNYKDDVTNIDIITMIITDKQQPKMVLIAIMIINILIISISLLLLSAPWISQTPFRRKKRRNRRNR